MVGISVRLTYDADADAAYVYLVDSIAPDGIAESRSSMLDLDRAFIAFDFDADGKVLASRFSAPVESSPNGSWAAARLDACND
jgi:uncharacterized protein YuzE